MRSGVSGLLPILVHFAKLAGKCPDYVRVYTINELKTCGQVYGDSCGLRRFYKLVPSFWRCFK